MAEKSLAKQILAIGQVRTPRWLTALLMPPAAAVFTFLMYASDGRPDVYFSDKVISYFFIPASGLSMILGYSSPKHTSAVDWLILFGLIAWANFFIVYPLKQ